MANTESFENGEISESASEAEEAERERGREEDPPPIPPRSNSLSPDTKSDVTAATVARDRAALLHGIENGSADHFLGGGRGDGGQSLSPLSDQKGGATPPSAGEDNEEIPPPIPEKMRGRAAPPRKPARDLKAEEGDLLDELNRLLSDQQRGGGGSDKERGGESVTTRQQDTEMVR